MFAELNGYGDYGRSLRKSISRVTSAVAKPVFKPIAKVTKIVSKPVLKVAKPVLKITKSIAKVPMKAVAKVTARQQTTGGAFVQESESELPEGFYWVHKGTRSEYIQGPEGAKFNLINNELVQIEEATPFTPAVGGARPNKIAQFRQFSQQMAQKNRATQQPNLGISVSPALASMTAVSIPQSMPTVAPVQSAPAQQQVYSPPMQQMQQQSQSEEQMQPEQSYYSEDRVPTEEGSTMQDEFRAEETEDDRNYPDTDDFSGYGLDIETTNLLNSEAKTNIPAAIQAGKDYVAKIQGKENTNIGAVVEENKGLNSIPAWMWLALGVSVFAMVATSSKKR